VADNENEVIIYERANEGRSIITAINNSFNDCENIEIQTDYPNEKYMDLIKGNIIKTSSIGKMKIDLKAKQGMILKRWIS
jgi:amylopullulanase